MNDVRADVADASGPGTATPRPTSQRNAWPWKGALLISAAVATGFGVVTTNSPVQSPGSVGQTFIEAALEGDEATAWALVCRQTRATSDFAGFTERLDRLTGPRPSNVDVAVDDVRFTGEGSAAWDVMVMVTVTSEDGDDEDWEWRGQVALVEEDDEFRIYT